MIELQGCTIPLNINSKNMHWLEGVTSNTDAAHLAEKFAETKCPTKVCVIPTMSCKAMNRGSIILKFVFIFFRWLVFLLH